MSLFRFRWFHKLIRRHTRPIPEENAVIWKRRISFGYAFIAWNAFGFVCYAIYQGKADWAAYHGLKSPEELALSPAQQWAKTLGKPDAKVYRLSGFHLEEIKKVEGSKDALENSKDSELNKEI